MVYIPFEAQDCKFKCHVIALMLHSYRKTSILLKGMHKFNFSTKNMALAITFHDRKRLKIMPLSQGRHFLHICLISESQL